MANHIIAILASIPNHQAPNKSKLTLSDNGNTIVNRGDTVTWIIDKDVQEISSILIMDNSTTDVFHPDPKPIKGKTSWTGVINPKPVKKGTEKEKENYTICWAQDGKTYAFDPSIQVND